MTGLTVEPEDGETIVLGKPVSELQANVTFGDDAVTGTLKLVTGYTEYSEDTEKQSGYYIALHVDTGGATDVETTVEVIHDEETETAVMDENGAAVVRFRGQSETGNTKTLRVTAKQGEESITETYTLIMTLDHDSSTQSQ